jgi:16S rRNA (cytidine1402-2'-O)-methyltransferase
LGNIDPSPTIPRHVREALETISLFVVEKPKTAVKFLSRMGIGGRLDRCIFVSADRLEDRTELSNILGELVAGKNIGMLSEAGCPGIADPGSAIVHAAHTRDIRVVPLVGPSSIVLALMASGMNGQQFSFEGYLPVDQQKRIARIRTIEQSTRVSGRTQVFIEAPHRNDHLFRDVLGTCHDDTLFCVAVDLTLPSEYIKTKSISAWKKDPFAMGKRPAIFLLGRSHG